MLLWAKMEMNIHNHIRNLFLSPKRPTVTKGFEHSNDYFTSNNSIPALWNHFTLQSQSGKITHQLKMPSLSSNRVRHSWVPYKSGSFTVCFRISTLTIHLDPDCANASQTCSAFHLHSHAMQVPVSEAFYHALSLTVGMAFNSFSPT